MHQPSSPGPNAPDSSRPDSSKPDSDAPTAGDWVDVADSGAVAEGSAIEVLVGTRILAIFRHDGSLHALDGMCAHQGGPIAQGTVQGGCVTCPWHGWQYELATGIQTINRQPLQQCFDVRQADGKIQVRLPETDSASG